ncbi:hypothetical protein HY640_01540 [Candidatus Woesearchaeota archaeon]|nr:hypothetical protein [Candidatus Woesearchaeota archaeon]
MILFDRFNMPEDLFETVFATKQQKIVATVLINAIKDKGGEIDRTEMSAIATELHEGKLQTLIDEPEFKGKLVRLSYNKRQFYDRILAPLRSMGMIDYDLYKKTYKLSDDFQNQMTKIGMKWTEYLKKPIDRKKQATATTRQVRI